jgi:hypothetical protein
LVGDTRLSAAIGRASMQLARGRAAGAKSARQFKHAVVAPQQRNKPTLARATHDAQENRCVVVAGAVGWLDVQTMKELVRDVAVRARHRGVHRVERAVWRQLEGIVRENIERASATHTAQSIRLTVVADHESKAADTQVVEQLRCRCLLQLARRIAMHLFANHPYLLQLLK